MKKFQLEELQTSVTKMAHGASLATTMSAVVAGVSLMSPMEAAD
ncbi:MAG TPA: hypothetical protein VI320_28980 [Terracidiphilus sp.]